MLCSPRDCSTPGFPVHCQLPELAQTRVYRVGNAIQPSHPLPSPSPPAFNLSQHQGLFQWGSSSYEVDWSYNFCISPFNEYSGLISFRIDWFDLLVVQGTLKSLLQQYSSKASILQCSVFFRVQLSHLYMTTGKTVAYTHTHTHNLDFKYYFKVFLEDTWASCSVRSSICLTPSIYN